MLVRQSLLYTVCVLQNRACKCKTVIITDVKIFGNSDIWLREVTVVCTQTTITLGLQLLAVSCVIRIESAII
jgi:hypothetical protein